MRRIMILAVATAALVSVAGCGGGSDPKPSSTTPAGATSPVGSVPPSSAASSSSATPGLSSFTGDSAREVLAKTQDAVDKATSVHVKGTDVEAGDTVSINLKLSFGKGAYGTITEKGSTIYIRRVGKTIWMKAPSAFWKKNAPGSEKLFGGQWLKGSATHGPLKDFASLTGRGLMTQILTPEGRISRVSGRPVAGVATVGLKDNDKSKPGILYISAAGKPYPLLTVPTGKKVSGKLRMAAWDEPVTLPAAPAGALNLDKMAGMSTT